MDREFYVEWLSILGKYSKSFYENMDDSTLEAEYLKIVGGELND